MKSCEGCRWLFAGKLFEKPAQFCRANPPILRIERVADQMTAQSIYPLAPKIRCGQFKRRWLFWRRDEV